MRQQADGPKPGPPLPASSLQASLHLGFRHSEMGLGRREQL